MPLKWEISHAERRVTITAEGFIPVEEVEEYYDAIVTANALSCARLFDAGGLDDKHARDEDFMRLGACMSAYAGQLKFGPIAFVITSPSVRNVIRRCLNLAPADRPMKIFSSVPRAKVRLHVHREVPA